MLYPEKETNLRSFILRDLLPSSVDSYYRYTGSLTMPPCSKVVEWIIFSRPVYLSHSQVRLVHTLACPDRLFSVHGQIPFAHCQWMPSKGTCSAFSHLIASLSVPPASLLHRKQTLFLSQSSGDNFSQNLELCPCWEIAVESPYHSVACLYIVNVQFFTHL